MVFGDRVPRWACWLRTAKPGTYGVPQLLVDERRVRVVGPVHPLLGVRPALASDVAGRDIIEVVQLVRANLLSPYAPADVLLVDEDCADGGMCPAPWVSVRIPLRVMRRGDRDVLCGEDVRDLLEPLSGSEHFEDSGARRARSRGRLRGGGVAGPELASWRSDARRRRRAGSRKAVGRRGGGRLSRPARSYRHEHGLRIRSRSCLDVPPSIPSSISVVAEL